MIRAAALLLALAGPVAAQDAAARMQPCLDATDAEFRRTAADPAAERWARLEVLSTGEARCLATVTSTCIRRTVDSTACFDDLLGWASERRRALVLRLPWALETGPADLRMDYERWREKARAALDRPSFSGCPFRSDAPPSACAALEAGTAYLEARDWARMITVIEEARP